MLKVLKVFIVLGLLGSLSLFSFPQDSQAPRRETGQTIGFDIVFVVDVSTGGKKDNKYISLLEKFVTFTYDIFQNSFEINAKNDYYLVTFTEKAAAFKSDKVDKDSIMKEIRKQIGSNVAKTSDPNRGLIKIFELFEENFPPKVGIIFFIYDSNIVKNKEDLQRTVDFLKKSGFTTFHIVLSELYRLKNIESLIKGHFEEALNIDLNSPVGRKEYHKKEIEWENKLKESEQKFDEKMNRSQPQPGNENKGEISSGDLGRETSIANNNQGYTGTGIFSFIFLFFLFIIILAVAYFIFYYKLWQEKYKFFKAIFLKKEKKKEGADIVSNTSTVDEKKEISWLPEYPAACRCKDRVDNREVIAFLILSLIQKTRRKRSAIKWLDLCCGNGNILAQIEKTMRKKISIVEYYGYDIDKKNIDECKKIIYSKKLDQRLGKVKVDVVNLDTSPIPGDQNFDIITLLNVMHEINPFKIYPLIKNALTRCKKDGLIVIVDMVNLPHLEWEAVTWTAENLVEVISYLTKNKNITYQDEEIDILIFERKVDIFCLHLYKNDVDENILLNWGIDTEIKKRDNIIIRCLEKKKNILSDQLTKIYHEKENIINRQEDLESKISKILWEYRSVCEHLLNFNKKKWR